MAAVAYCSFCGQEWFGDVAFCPYCGRRAAGAAASDPPVVARAAGAEPSRRSVRWKPVALAGAALAIAGLAALAFEEFADSSSGLPSAGSIRADVAQQPDAPTPAPALAPALTPAPEPAPAPAAATALETAPAPVADIAPAPAPAGRNRALCSAASEAAGLCRPQ